MRWPPPVFKLTGTIGNINGILLILWNITDNGLPY